MSRAAGLALGWLADQVLGDPARWHPVAGFGSLARTLETRMYAAHRGHGVAHLALLALPLTGAVAALERATRRHGIGHTLVVAASTWTVLGGRSLLREAEAVEERLRAADLPGARAQVGRIVGRSTASLDEVGVARACLESLAENTSDAVVAPLLWGAVLGTPGLVAYRVVNTLDAMVGHRSERYREFGWAAARLDDLLNWVPARVAALLAAAAAPLAGGTGSAAEAVAAVRRDARHHPSPNGGVVEASFAGALGVVLGGVNDYGGVLEDRGTLGAGRPATPADVEPGRRLAWWVQAGSAGVVVGAAHALSARRRVMS
ncbi:cobalamin biosynthesis protein CobD [Intrasporangium chromatireducens Q5-1]|uniref:Cobalamin biosynthesis protein CobD n=1 Tax=Intrasporangium chromatireducens Q5-1 TaxID=584657 RepID=W9GLC5_9MICO|nr:adenosylcobinamide-phosphate synthase CbiB [Intrasporangium chromatireducens]EWT07041.1 cobalamin biosynthesis protein CobD [Intrasporangium chromatireducens Q5-1]